MDGSSLYQKLQESSIFFDEVFDEPFVTVILTHDFFWSDIHIREQFQQISDLRSEWLQVLAMSGGDIILASHVDGIEHSIIKGIVVYPLNAFVHSCIVEGVTNLVFIELEDSVWAVSLVSERW